MTRDTHRRELAQQLGVSTGALLRWTRAGKVPAVKLPSGAVRYLPEQIKRGSADRTVSTCPGNLITTRVSAILPPLIHRLHGQREE